MLDCVACRLNVRECRIDSAVLLFFGFRNECTERAREVSCDYDCDTRAVRLTRDADHAVTPNRVEEAQSLLATVSSRHREKNLLQDDPAWITCLDKSTA